ncbi:hypothetical protein [Ichthyenterobacterium magnum]|uniref:Uncharacterized protein n=1 Tax=Ichthyenterobacterium magnum TaxID=1230530 RepID=A0A420DY49_9FLAO|nr:hypothetical protein [Ichthyenterobacterium magnum]RKE99111.1 hypothetical protein BXY80_1213 [Ichthyenterobacterium magnum]
MKTKKNTLCLLLIISIINISPIFSQSGKIIESNLRGQFFNSIKTNINNVKSNVTGSPYLNEEFTPARIALNKEERIYNMRYNAYSDVFEFKNEKNEKYAINKSIKDVTITLISTGKVFELIDYKDGDFNKKGYFIHLSLKNDSVKLFKKNSVLYVPAKTSSNGYNKPKPAAFIKNSDKFYLRINDNPAILIPRNKKDFAKLFPALSKDILAYIKTNKIKTSKEADLLKLINYINSIQ